ncbi:hypothetical protein D0Y19_06210 [Campylobacter upsaliensis]|nr:hypothetical protein [Campylobacter upsaliensis]
MAFCLVAWRKFVVPLQASLLPATRLINSRSSDRTRDALLDLAPPPHKKGVKFSLAFFCEAFLPCSRLS